MYKIIYVIVCKNIIFNVQCQIYRNRIYAIAIQCPINIKTVVSDVFTYFKAILDASRLTFTQLSMCSGGSLDNYRESLHLSI